MRALLAWLVGVQGFGRLQDSADSKGHTIATEAMAKCEQQLSHTLGPEWFGCVVDELLRRQDAAKHVGSDDYYPVVPHELSPLFGLILTALNDNMGAVVSRPGVLVER